MLEAIAADAAYTTHAANLSGDWRGLALEHVEAGNLSEAILAAGRIVRVWALISMRADRRFDALTTAAPELFDIEQAAAFEIEHASVIRANKPRSLQAVVDLAWALQQAGRIEEGLDLIDMAISYTSEAVVEQPYWEDPGEINWAFDIRAGLLVNLGRWDEAIAQFESASEMSERRRSNVSQTINFASLSAKLGKTDLARATLNKVPDRRSDYGDAQVRAVELMIGIQEGDTGQIRRSLRRLQRLEEAASATLLLALTRAGQFDEAAQMLIRQLRDPDERLSILIDLQDYHPLPQPPALSGLGSLTTLLERPDVGEVVNEVGRVESFDVLHY